MRGSGIRARHNTRRLTAATALAVFGSFVVASAAMGTFHETKIREISGDPGGNNEAYVELQMYRAGNNQITGHDFICYDAAGAVTDTFPITDPNPSNAGNQRTILVGDSNVQGGRDLDFNPDSCLAGGGSGAVGAICFETVDCVAWGGAAFTGAANLPDNTTPYAGVLPNTDNGDPAIEDMALRRDISRNCTNLLEASDDTNNAANDFDKVLRDPTLNAISPGNTNCIGAPKCGGVFVTRSGTAGANLIIGTNGRDVIRGLGGNDIIRGRGGKDILCGGKGKDVLVGGGGRDRLLGQAGSDTCRGGPKKDKAKKCEIRRSI